MALSRKDSRAIAQLLVAEVGREKALSLLKRLMDVNGNNSYRLTVKAVYMLVRYNRWGIPVDPKP